MHKIPLLPLHNPHHHKCHLCKDPATDEAHIANHVVAISIKTCKNPLCVNHAKKRASDHWQDHLDSIEAARKAKAQKDDKAKRVKPIHKSRNGCGQKLNLTDLANSI